MSLAQASAHTSNFKYFRLPNTVVRRFVAKKSLRSALMLGIVLDLYMISKAESFIKTYPTSVARQKLAETLGQNVGIEAILGVAHHLDTVAGYVTWNFLCLIAAIGAIWALLLATKTFRGEEDSGRWELFLAGQTSSRKATTNALAGLARNIAIVYVCLVLAIAMISRTHGANFSIGSSLFLSLALIVGASEFIAVGALASQLMPVRSRATSLAAIIFGVFYTMRLIADTTSAHWLLDISPLGWAEKLQPMYGPKPLWLLPIAGFILILILLTIYLAGRRDLGEGILADKEDSKPHLRLLTSPFGAALRLNRNASLSWLIGIGLAGFLYGLLAKGAVQALSQSAGAQKAINRLVQSSQTQEVVAFMGITFFLIMLITMFYAANAVAHIREDEAEGYVDNFLVRPLSRNRWLVGRISLITIVIILAGVISGLATWAGDNTQHGGVSLHTLLLAGFNAVTPVILVLGVGIFAFGLIPRLTSAIIYSVIGWSFLIVMLSSGLSINHWLLDTSILHQVSLAPAVNADWTTDAVMVGLGIVLAALGALRFNWRDLASE
jgi:ABC-2 type transport system permease protein